jgi:hypothetical protein
MSFVPLLQFEKIYVGGGKPSLQMKLVSAIVTSVISKSSVIRQKSTIERLRQNNPDLVSNVSKQLEVLKSNTDSTMDASSGSTNPGKQEASDEDVSPQDFVEQSSQSLHLADSKNCSNNKKKLKTNYYLHVNAYK